MNVIGAAPHCVTVAMILGTKLSVGFPWRFVQRSSPGDHDDKLVGMLQVLLKALDPSELRVTGFKNV